MKYLLLLTTALFPIATFAASPVSDVGSPVVNASEVVVENRIGYGWDDTSRAQDRSLRMRQHLDYGLNDWYAARLIVAEGKQRGDAFEYSSLTMENRFQLIERRAYGWDGGIRLNYSEVNGANAANKIELRLLAQVPLGERWEYRNNISLKHDIGKDSRAGIALELRQQMSRNMADIFHPCSAWGVEKISLGLEMYNDFSRLRDVRGATVQDHRLRPGTENEF